MRASSEQHHVQEGEDAALAMDQDELAKEGKAGAAVSSSQGKTVCGEEEVVGSVRPHPQTGGKWS